MQVTDKNYITTPVGRLVGGSLYEPQTDDANGRPLMDKSGKPRVNFYFAIAIPKGKEQHWSHIQVIPGKRTSEWGAKIWAEGHAGFPNGQANSSAFAWKITDGDSQIPNANGRRPCDRPGYAGCWILNFSSSFAPGIYDRNGVNQLPEKDFINAGDYIQVAGTVVTNGEATKPGVYLNHIYVAFVGYGERISFGPDIKSLGFGEDEVPHYVSPTPVGGNFAPVQPAATNFAPPPVHPVQNTVHPVVPHYEILNPQKTQAPGIPPVPVQPIMPPQPTRIMLPKAAGYTYEQYKAAGYTDEILIQQGYMAA